MTASPPTLSHGAAARAGEPAVIDVAPIDLAFGRLVARGLEPALAELLLHSAVLVSAERALGNSCIELGDYAGALSPHGLDRFTYPAVPAWRDALLASGRCATASGDHEAALLVLDGTRLYLPRYHAAERRLSAAIRARVTAPHAASLHASVSRFRALFPAAATGADWQALAAVAALRSSLVFVTGGPGTGKTTVAAKLLALLLDRDPSLRLAVAAPTGRAAARLVEAIGAAAAREALGDVITPRLPTVGATLHRLLGYQPWNDCFRHHAGRPLADDVVVVDEASMVDVLMMDALFAALKPSARLIVLGDPDQLASVDTGFVLGDVARAAQRAGRTPEQPSPALAAAYATLSGAPAALLESDATAGALRDAVVRLRVSYRFGAQPGIGALAEATRRGDGAQLLVVLDDAAHPEVSRQEPGGNGADVLAGIRPLVEAYLETTEPALALAALARFRVLCALRDGDAGVTGLNALVEQWLQRRGDPVTGWYDHRPVLITANDPGTALFNGDVGTTLAVDGVPMVHFPVPGGGVRSFTPSRLPAYETAWAMTVHKSQGSEFDHVVLVLPDSDTRVLTRELLYTGITRARRAVTVIASPDTLLRGASRTVARSSGLVDRLV